MIFSDLGYFVMNEMKRQKKEFFFSLSSQIYKPVV